MAHSVYYIRKLKVKLGKGGIGKESTICCQNSVQCMLPKTDLAKQLGLLKNKCFVFVSYNSCVLRIDLYLMFEGRLYSIDNSSIS